MRLRSSRLGGVPPKSCEEGTTSVSEVDNMVLPMPRMERNEILLLGSPRRPRLSTGIAKNSNSSKCRSQVISQRLQAQPTLLVPQALPSAAESITPPPSRAQKMGQGGDTHLVTGWTMTTLV